MINQSVRENQIKAHPGLNIPLPKTKQGIAKHRKKVHFLAVFSILTTLLAAKIFYNHDPALMFSGSIFVLFVIVVSWFLIIERLAFISSPQDLDTYIKRCEEYPELLQYHKTLNRKPLRWELGEFERFHVKSLNDKEKTIIDSGYRKLEEMKKKSSGDF